MSQLNSYRLILISFIDSIVSSAFIIGVLFYLQQTNRELFANSIVANISSVATIMVILFIGAMVDRKSKKKIIILSNLLLACIAWIPGYFYESKSFFVVLLIVDLFVALFNLMSNSSMESYLKGAIEEEKLKKTISLIQLMSMIGLVIGIVLMSFTIDYFSVKVFFAGASLIYLLNLLFIMGLSKDVVSLENTKPNVLREIKLGFNYIKDRKFLRSNIYLAVTLTATQGYVASLVIYYWSEIDADFEYVDMLIYGIGIGLIAGMLIVNLIKNESKITVICFSVIGSIAMCFMFLCKTPLSLAIILGMIFGCIQVAGVLIRTQRIKITDLNVQGRINSFNKLFTSIITLIMAIGVSYIGQLIHFIFLPIIALAVSNIIFLINYTLKSEENVFNEVNIIPLERSKESSFLE